MVPNNYFMKEIEENNTLMQKQRPAYSIATEKVEQYLKYIYYINKL